MTGGELRVAREALGLSRRALSVALAGAGVQVAAHTLYEWERGLRHRHGGVPSGVAEWVRKRMGEVDVGERAKRA